MANRDGIRHIKEDTYEVSFYPSPKAKRVFKRIKAPSLREAKIERGRLIAESDTINPERESLPFAEIKIKLSNDLMSDNVAPNSLKRFMLTWQTFFENFLPLKYSDIKDIKQLSARVFADYKNYIVNERGRKEGWRSEIGILKPIFRRLVRLECCPKTVYESLQEFKRPKAKEKDYKEITKTDKRLLLDYIKKDRPDYYGVTYFLIRIGWRIDETLSIKRANIKWNGLIPLSIKSEACDRKQGKTFILSPIDEDLAKVLRKYAFDRRKTVWLFPNRSNKKHSARHYAEYLSKISQNIIHKKITPHDFRHSLITELVNVGVAPKTLMGITGHLDINTIMKFYSHSTEDDKRKALALTIIEG